MFGLYVCKRQNLEQDVANGYPGKVIVAKSPSLMYLAWQWYYGLPHVLEEKVAHNIESRDLATPKRIPLFETHEPDMGAYDIENPGDTELFYDQESGYLYTDRYLQARGVDSHDERFCKTAIFNRDCLCESEPDCNLYRLMEMPPKATVVLPVAYDEQRERFYTYNYLKKGGSIRIYIGTKFRFNSCANKALDGMVATAVVIRRYRIQNTMCPAISLKRLIPFCLPDPTLDEIGITLRAHRERMSIKHKEWYECVNCDAQLITNTDFFNAPRYATVPGVLEVYGTSEDGSKLPVNHRYIWETPDRENGNTLSSALVDGTSMMAKWVRWAVLTFKAKGTNPSTREHFEIDLRLEEPSDDLIHFEKEAFKSYDSERATRLIKPDREVPIQELIERIAYTLSLSPDDHFLVKLFTPCMTKLLEGQAIGIGHRKFCGHEFIITINDYKAYCDMLSIRERLLCSMLIVNYNELAIEGMDCRLDRETGERIPYSAENPKEATEAIRKLPDSWFDFEKIVVLDI